MAIDYNTSESRVHYTLKKIEEMLLSDDRFHLRSLKKWLPTDESSIDVIVVDVTESPCERSKKAKALLLRQKATLHRMRTRRAKRYLSVETRRKWR